MDNTNRPAVTVHEVEAMADQLIPGNSKVEKAKKIGMFINVGDDQVEDYRKFVTDKIMEYLKVLALAREKWTNYIQYCGYQHIWNGIRPKGCHEKLIRHLKDAKADKMTRYLALANRKLLVKNVINKYVQMQYKNYKHLKANKENDPRQLRDLKELFGTMAIKQLRNMSTVQRKAFYIGLVKNMKKSKDRRLFFGALRNVGAAIGNFFSRFFEPPYKRKERERSGNENRTWGEYHAVINTANRTIAEDKAIANPPNFSPQQRVPYIPKNPEKPFASCVNENRTFIRPFLTSNNEKLKHCETIIGSVKRFDIFSFRAMLKNARDRLNSILLLKKTLYCSVCDAHEQKYFNSEHNMIVLSQDYCHGLLANFRDYIWWKNVLMVEYLESVFQLMNCSGGVGNIYTFPSPTILSWHKRRIFFIRRCYNNLDTKNFYRYCRFMCVQYKIHGYSKFFEGDPDLLKKVYFKIVSYLRTSYGKEDFTLVTLRRARLRTKTIKVKKLLAKIRVKKRPKFKPRKRSSKKGKGGKKGKAKGSKGKHKKDGKAISKPKGGKKGAKGKKGKKSLKKKSKKSKKLKKKELKKSQKKKPMKKIPKKKNIKSKKATRVVDELDDDDPIEKERKKGRFSKYIVTTFYLKKKIERMRFFMEKRLRMKDIKEPIRPFAYRESYLSNQIYEKVHRPYYIRCWKSFFSYHKNALNPLRDISVVNFDYTMTNLLRQQMKRSKKEKLARGVLESVFAANRESEYGFNHEFDYENGDPRKATSTKDEDKANTVIENGIVKPLNRTAGVYDWIEQYVNPNSNDRASKTVHNMMHVLHSYL